MRSDTRRSAGCRIVPGVHVAERVDGAQRTGATRRAAALVRAGSDHDRGRPGSRRNHLVAGDGRSAGPAARNGCARHEHHEPRAIECPAAFLDGPLIDDRRLRSDAAAGRDATSHAAGAEPAADDRPAIDIDVEHHVEHDHDRAALRRRYDDDTRDAEHDRAMPAAGLTGRDPAMRVDAENGPFTRTGTGWHDERPSLHGWERSGT